MDHNSWPTASSTSAKFDIKSSMSSRSLKRQREHEAPGVYNEDSSRESKKHCPLPLLSPQKAGQRSKLVEVNPLDSLSAYPPSALTPVESSDDEYALPASNPTKSQQFLHSSHSSRVDCDTSMDIDDSENPGSMDREARSLLSVTESGRNARHIASAPRDIACQSFSTGRPVTISPFNSLDSQSALTELTGNPLWWRCPRLPSPVSDNGDGMSGIKDTSDDAEMLYEPSPLNSIPPLGSVNSSAIEAEAADMRERLSSLDLPDQANTKLTSTLKSPKKPVFSMGYRADCDKCRRRVPGHYSHIIG
ncbi:hypothetical protein BDW62DRAFT_174042 [Aspergillus aurantiobrunneus]